MEKLRFRSLLVKTRYSLSCVSRNGSTASLTARAHDGNKIALSLAASAVRRDKAGRLAFAELSFERQSAELGSDGRVKTIWRLLREGRNPMLEHPGGLGKDTRLRLAALDGSGRLAAALRNDAVEAVTAASLKLAPNRNGFEASVQQELGCGTTKYLLRLKDGLAVESVLIPQVEHAVRQHARTGRKLRSTTICVSSQVGCSQGCAFCKTGAMGIVRNLCTDELLAQVVQGIRLTQDLGLPRARNVVLMGMGEPLNNLSAVMPLTQALADNHRMAFGRKKVVLSTVGTSPSQVRALAGLPCQFSWSLHCADDTLRKQLIPSAKFSILELRDAFADVLGPQPRLRDRRLMVAVVLLHGINDTRQHAQAVAHLLHPLVDSFGITVLLDLIPYNDVGRMGFSRPTDEAVQAYAEEARAVCPALRIYVRHPRGEEAMAACGQLATQPLLNRAQGPRALTSAVSSVEELPLVG